LIADGSQPVSLGVWPKGEPETTMIVPTTLIEQMGSGVLAISDEPQSGSQTGAPTGDVFAEGQVTLVH
jgi:anti-sigma-K factor RskA